MSEDPLADVVSGQYERWMYPEPIEDLPAWLVGNWQWFDPSHAHAVLWPQGDQRTDLDILIAGCGTNQAAVFAYNNPDATVVAIDVSQPSLDHHRKLAHRYGLRNLELHLLPIEDVATLHREFDLIVSTGVLHHLADPQAGLNALASCLRPNGVVALMLYARYGRIGVEVMEGVFRDMGLAQDDRSLAIVRQALEDLPSEHPVRSYLSIAPDLRFDAGLVDTFLHGRERSYTVRECLDLVAAADLVFQEWFFKAPYEPPRSPGDVFLSAVSALPDEARWSVMERINTRNACHFFLAHSVDRPGGPVRSEPTDSEGMRLVPRLRHRCGLDGVELVRPGRRWTLNPAQLTVVRRMDGRRSVGEIIDAVVGDDPAIFSTGDVARDVVVTLVRELWESDYIAFGRSHDEMGPE